MPPIRSLRQLQLAPQSQAGVARSLAVTGDAGTPHAARGSCRPWYNPALESAIYFVPGVIGCC
jgi:hypothetical protein